MQTATAHLLADFAEFSARCEAEEYTDTGEAWHMLERLAERLREVEAPTQPGQIRVFDVKVDDIIIFSGSEYPVTQVERDGEIVRFVFDGVNAGLPYSYPLNGILEIKR